MLEPRQARPAPPSTGRKDPSISLLVVLLFKDDVVTGTVVVAVAESPHQSPPNAAHVSFSIGLQRPLDKRHGLLNCVAHVPQDSIGVGAGAGTGICVVEGIGIGTGMGMGIGTGAGKGKGVGSTGAGVGKDEPPPACTVMSAQFQNCSPQPECPLGPSGPEQAPLKAVHQALLDPSQ